MKAQEYLNTYLGQIKENCTVHTNGVKQFEYQILLEWNKK
jgi:hypothetical protein